MSRRMDREGICRSETQRVQNQRFWDDPRCVEDAKGWVQPFANWQGWDELNHAIYALKCVMLFRRVPRRIETPLIRDDGSINYDELWRGTDHARIESDMRSFHSHIARSRRCDRPALP